jgi:hypothetical protein
MLQIRLDEPLRRKQTRYKLLNVQKPSMNREYALLVVNMVITGDDIFSSIVIIFAGSCNDSYSPPRHG